MKWQNKVQLIGYLGEDPKLLQFSSGTKCMLLRLATHEGFTQKEKKPITNWHTIKLWGERSSKIHHYFIKGSHVLVDGKLVYRSYQDKEGHRRYVTEIEAAKLVNLDR